MHKLPDSSHTNTDITPLHHSLDLNICLLQFVLLQLEDVKSCPFPIAVAEALPPAKLMYTQERSDPEAQSCQREKRDNLFYWETFAASIREALVEDFSFALCLQTHARFHCSQ